MIICGLCECWKVDYFEFVFDCFEYNVVEMFVKIVNINLGVWYVCWEEKVIEVFIDVIDDLLSYYVEWFG